RDDVVSKAFLSITCRATVSDFTVTVGDNGPGIPVCRHCAEKNCLDCAVFGVGKTTKVNGSGLGLINVRTAARRIGARVIMKSVPDAGVETEITVPRGIDAVTR
ncbi:MAG: ATP-binding protein, partial [Spirochaeta sp.]|nr:ATP-binding protein [Spirochaeta sp.]